MKIQNYIKTVPILLSILMFLGCSEELTETPSIGSHQTGEPVTVVMSTRLPEASATTRLMDGSNSPEITQLWVAAFTADHYLKQVAKATPVDASGTLQDKFTPDANGVTYFAVTLNTTEDLLTMHLVANYALDALPFGMEGQVIGTLETTGKQDVYWQRVTGVPVKLTDTNVKNAATNPIVIEAPEQLVEVPMVRNYAMLSVNNGEEDLKVTGYALTNLPDRGSVAPRISDNKFAEYYVGTKRAATCKTYADLLGQGYRGNEPYDVERSKELTWVEPTDDDKLPDSYIYEYNNTRDEKQTLSLIVRGIYKDDTKVSYYKMDLVYTDEEGYAVYYNVLRNFKYAVEIEKVTGSGYATAEDAIAQPACNNLSGSTIVKSLTNISDGTYQLYVDRTSIVIVKNESVTFRYRYIYLEDPGQDVNDRISLSYVTGDDGHVLKQNPTVSATESDGWRTVTLTPNDPTNQTEELKETLVLVDKERALMREVDLTLVRPYTIELEATPSNPEQVYNYPVTLNVYLPVGLPQSIFPLTFDISDKNKTLYPQANTGMPVNVENGSYSFLKQLTYADYQKLEKVIRGTGNNAHDMKQMDLLFMTNALVSTTTVTIKNDYFTDASTAITAQSNSKFFKNVNISGTEYFGINHTVTVKFTTNSAGSVTIKFDEAASKNKAGDDLAAKSQTEPRNVTANTEYTVEFKTETFKGDITITVSGGTGNDEQKITLKNPTKRHIIHIPEHSFWFDSKWAGKYTWKKEHASDDKGDFEWPDIIIDGYDSGSRKMYPTRYTGTQTYAGTTAYNNDAAYPKALLDIDAQYGGREVDFYPDSKVRFKGYYAYDADGNALYGTDSEGHGKLPYYECNLEDITNAWNPNLRIIDFKIDFRTDGN
ncbi:MAG: hypothetical protein IJ551_09020 [Prevotella sp.]|nr:hypothetical protein [Prevotella sp.]